MNRTFIRLTLCWLAMFTASSVAEVRIQINDQQYRYSEPVRLSQVLSPVAQGSNWYWPASALYNLDAGDIEAKRNQILQQIDQLVLELEPQEQQALSLRALRQQIEGWQLARRIRQPVHYDVARLDIRQNPAIGHGVYLLKLTGRPKGVHLVGQVQMPGTYEYQPASAPFHFVEGVVIRGDAESDYVYVIAPDGEVRKVGTAYWNREWRAVMPGSQIFVPLSSSLFSPALSSLNQQIAELAVHRVLP